MKSNPENIAIATLYLFLLLITLYVIKLAFQKYRALDQRKQRQMQDSIYK